MGHVGPSNMFIIVPYVLALLTTNLTPQLIDMLKLMLQKSSPRLTFPTLIRCNNMILSPRNRGKDGKTLRTLIGDGKMTRVEDVRMIQRFLLMRPKGLP